MVEGSTTIEVASTDDTLIMDSKPPQAEAIMSSSSEDTDESNKDKEQQQQQQQHERAESDVLRPSMVPKWLQDLEHNMASATGTGATTSDDDNSSTNLPTKTTPTLKSTHSSNNSIFSSSSRRASSMIAPDWIKEFEQEQKKLLDALARDQSSRSLLGGGGLGLCGEQDDAVLEPLPGTTAVAVATLDDTWDQQRQQQQSTPAAQEQPRNKQQQQLQLHRESVTPEWLLGFEAEQKKLLQAMKDPISAGSKFQDSFAMMEDDEELELMATEAAEVVQAATAPAEEETPKNEEAEKMITPTNSGVAFEEEKKESSPAYNKNNITTTTTTAAAATTTNRRDSRASSLAVPDWLVEFENQQNELFQMLDRRASTMPLGDNSLSQLSVALGSNNNNTTAATAAEKRRQSSMMINTPDWLKEFENQQKELLDELHSMNRSSIYGGTIKSTSLDKTGLMLSEEEEDDDKEEEPESTEQQPSTTRMENSASAAAPVIANTEDQKAEAAAKAAATNKQKATLAKLEKEKASRERFLQKQKEMKAKATTTTTTTADEEPSPPPVAATTDNDKELMDIAAGAAAAAAAAAAEVKNSSSANDDDKTAKMKNHSATTSTTEPSPQKLDDHHPSIDESKSPTLDDLEDKVVEDSKEKDISSSLASALTTNQLESAKGRLATTRPSEKFTGHNRPTEYQNFKLRKTPPRPPQQQKTKPPPPVPVNTTDEKEGADGIDDNNNAAGANEFQKFQLRKISPTVAQRNIAESKLQFAQLVAQAITPKNNNNNNNSNNDSRSSALVKNAPAWSEALRHMDHLKEQVEELQNLERDQLGSSWAQINKLQDAILKVYDTGEDSSNLWKNWLLPLRPNRASMAMKFGFLADADAEQLAKLKQDEWDQAGGMGIVKKVLELNFKAIHGPNCLQTIHDYAMLKFGKKKKPQRNDGWQSLLAKLFEDAQKAGEQDDEDVHLRVRNSLVQWVVREILYTSRDTVSSRMCFHATYLIAMLKLELQRLAPAVLEQQFKSTSKSDDAAMSASNQSQESGGAFGFNKKESGGVKRGSGRLVDAPDIVKKLLNREQSGGGPKDSSTNAQTSSTTTGPSDLPPDHYHQGGAGGSEAEARVDFVRETINDKTTEEDTMEEKAKIKSRASTFVRLEAKETNDMDESRVTDAVRSYKPPTDYDLVLQELMTSTVRKDSLTPPPHHHHSHSRKSDKDERGMDSSNNETNVRRHTKPTDTTTASLGGKPATISEMEPSSTENNNAAVTEIDTSQKEDETDLPLPIQDAHRVIRTILGPSHPNITVSLCFEALRVYAALIDGWKDVDADTAGDGAGAGVTDPSKQQSKPTAEESRVKSLEGSVFRTKGAALPATVIHINQQLELEKDVEQQKQDEEEKRARLSIARKREEKMKHRKQRAKKGHKKGGTMQDNSEMSHLSQESAANTSKASISSAPSPPSPKPRTTKKKAATGASSPTTKASPSNNSPSKPRATRKKPTNSPSSPVEANASSSTSSMLQPPVAATPPKKATNGSSSPAGKSSPSSSSSRKRQATPAKKQATSTSYSSPESSPPPSTPSSSSMKKPPKGATATPKKATAESSPSASPSSASSSSSKKKPPKGATATPKKATASSASSSTSSPPPKRKSMLGKLVKSVRKSIHRK